MTDATRAPADPLRLAPVAARLFDEHSDPDFRDVFGALAHRSQRVDVAITRIRLTGLDLRPPELRGAREIRVLLAEMNALTMSAEAEAVMTDPDRASNLRLVVDLLGEGRIFVRSAPLAGWSPDFSIFHDSTGPAAVLLGFHWFQRPFPQRGPALASLHGRDAAEMAAGRFDELWARAHDISPAVRGLLARATGGDGGGCRDGCGPPVATRG